MAHKALRSLPVKLAALLLAAWGLSGTCLQGQDTQDLQGQVINGTTQKPVAGAEVLLRKAGAKGMETVRPLRTDSSGRFTAGSRESLAKEPFVLQTVYQEVAYSLSTENLKDSGQALLTVYETTDKLEPVKVGLPHMMVRRVGNVLQISEIFQVENLTQPPQTMLARQSGFRFALPSGARLMQVVASSESSVMPVTVESRSLPGQSGSYVESPLKPGKTMIQVAYETDYAGEQAELSLKYFYPLQLFQMMVAPGDIQVQSPLLKETGRQGNRLRLFSAPSVPADTALTVRLSGGSPQVVESEEGDEEGRSRNPMPAGEEEESAGQSVVAVPPRLAAFRFVILGNLVLLLAAFIGWALTGRTGEQKNPGGEPRTRNRKTEPRKATPGSSRT